jgi:hypothetical protein
MFAILLFILINKINSQFNIGAITNYINQYRNLHQSPFVIYDPTISVYSQQWANYIASIDILQHSDNYTYGENLSEISTQSLTDYTNLIYKGIDSWYNEGIYYDYNNPGYSTITGHFTALIWKSTTKFGIGVALSNKNHLFIVVNFYPPGNINLVNYFILNVLPKPVLPSPMPSPSPLPLPSPMASPIPLPSPIPKKYPPPSSSNCINPDLCKNLKKYC